MSNNVIPLHTRNSRAGMALHVDTHRVWPRATPAQAQPRVTEAELDAHNADMREPPVGAAGHASSELLADDWDGAELRARLQVDDMLGDAAKWLFRAAVAVAALGALFGNQGV